MKSPGAATWWALSLAALSSIVLWSSVGLPGISDFVLALASVSLPLGFGALSLASPSRKPITWTIFLLTAFCLCTATWIVVVGREMHRGFEAMIFGLWLFPLLISTIGFALSFAEFDISEEEQALFDRYKQERDE